MAIKLFVYFIKEILPQFFTAFCILSSVIVISQLVRLSDVLAAFGITFENVLLPFLFILMPFFSFTVPIAYMFAVFLGFSRLSADGELTAMLASGYSLRKAAVPVMLLGFLLFGVGAVAASYFEAWGRRQYIDFYKRKAQTEIDNMLKVNLKPGVFLDNFLGYVLYAETISADGSQLENVMLAPGIGQQKTQNFTLLAPSASLTGSVTTGNLKMGFDYGVIHSLSATKDRIDVMKFKHMEIDLLRIFQDQIFGPDSVTDDYRSYPPMKLWHYVKSLKNATEPRDKQTYYKAAFLFHQRFGMPFAAVVFALFAMVFGIQDERRGKSYGYAACILVLMLGYVTFMAFKWLGENGTIPALWAAWLPNILMASIGGFLLYQKNRLPPSEQPWDPHHLPFLRRWYGKSVSSAPKG